MSEHHHPAPGPDGGDPSPAGSLPEPDPFRDELLAAAAGQTPGAGRVVTGPRLTLRQAMAELGVVPLSEVSLAEVVRRVAALAQATVPGADEVSVTVLDGGRAGTVAFTGDLAVHLDERQYEAGFGPCLDAASRGEAIRLRDLAQEDRYPAFASAALRAGVTGTLSVGMALPGQVVGGLNIYSRGGPATGAALDDGSVAVAEAFAGYAAVVLANAGALRRAQRLAAQMQEAMASRATIEQAKGVLVARTGVTPDEAFAELTRRSRATGRKLASLAAETVSQAQRGTGPPPAGTAAPQG